MNATIKTVAIVEDHLLIAQQLQQMITNSPDFSCAGTFHSFSDAKHYLSNHAPDLLLVDLGLPDGHGKELIQLVEENNRHKQQHTECLVLTMYGDEAHVMDALGAGAVGYLLKDAEQERVIKALEDIVRGGSPITPVIARALLTKFSSQSHDAHPDAAVFTAKEEEILSFFAKGFTRKEIAGYMHLSVNTVNTHAKRIFKKLAVHSQSEAVFEAVQQGIIQLD